MTRILVGLFIMCVTKYLQYVYEQNNGDYIENMQDDTDPTMYMAFGEDMHEYINTEK